MDLHSLAAIRILAAIGRTYQTRRIHVSPFQVFVLKLAIVDARRACAVSFGNVAALDHELVNDPVKGHLGVGHAIVFARTQLSEAGMQCECLVWRVHAGLLLTFHMFGAFCR